MLAALAVAGLGIYAIKRLTRFEHVDYDGPAAPAFSLRVLESDAEQVTPKGDEILRLNAAGPGGAIRQRLIVSPLRLAAREGAVSAQLGLEAHDYLARARGRYRGYRPVEEGRIRLNGAEGYQLVFTARYIAPDRVVRRLFGKIVLLPEPVERPRRGVAIELLATTLSQVKDAPAVGSKGPMTTPFRSFRYEDV